MAGVAPWHEQTILKHYLPVKAQFLSGKLLTFWKNCLPFGKTVYLSVKVHYLPVKSSLPSGERHVKRSASILVCSGGSRDISADVHGGGRDDKDIVGNLHHISLDSIAAA